MKVNKVITKLKMERPALIKLIIVMSLAIIIAVVDNNTVIEWLRNVLIFNIFFTIYKEDVAN